MLLQAGPAQSFAPALPLLGRLRMNFVSDQQSSVPLSCSSRLVTPMSHSTLPSYSPTDPSAAGVKPQLAPEIAAAAASNSTSGFIRSCPRDELAGARFPPHMRDAVGALRLTRNALSVCLAEETIFIRPPRADVRADEKNMHGMGVRALPSSRPRRGPC